MDRLDHRFVIIIESIENDVSEIFSIEWTTKKSESISFCFDQLHVGIDIFVAFDAQLELLLELLDVAPSRFAIRSRESTPSLKSRLRCGDEWLKRDLNSAHECAKEKVIMSLPSSESRIWRDHVVDGDCCSR